MQNAISSGFSRPSSACVIGERAQRADDTENSANASHTRAAVPHQATHYHNAGSPEAVEMENPSPLPALSAESSIFKADPGTTFVDGPFFP